MLLRQFSQGLVSLECRQRNLRFECRSVVPPLPSCHALAPFWGRSSGPGLKQGYHLARCPKFWCPLSSHAKSDADEAADGLAVVDRVLRTFIRQTEALLCDVHAQHPQDADRRPAATFTLGIVRFIQSLQPSRHTASPLLCQPEIGRAVSASSCLSIPVRKRSSVLLASCVHRIFSETSARCAGD